MNTVLAAPLNYERRGAGPPLLLLHGIGHRWQAWEPVLDRLARMHDVIAVDLPGFGQSPPVPGADHPPGIARAIVAFADRLGLDRPHVAGNSLGGAVALELAAAGLVSSATVLSPLGFGSTRGQRLRIIRLRLLRLSTFLPVAILRAVLGRAWLRALALSMIVYRPRQLSAERAVGDALAMRDGRAFTTVAKRTRGYRFRGTPQVPVTVAWALHDHVLPYRDAATARDRLPGARHVNLPGCGHVPMSDDPDLVAETILATTKTA